MGKQRNKVILCCLTLQTDVVHSNYKIIGIFVRVEKARISWKENKKNGRMEELTLRQCFTF